MEWQVILSDFSNIDLPTVIHSKGWESLCDIPITCPSVLIQEFYSNMHGFDYSVPLFVTRVRGTRIVVTPDIISNVLHVPKVAHPNYSGYDHLKTVSKDELISSFCEHPSCHDHLKTVSKDELMTFVLHPLSHYISFTKPHARFFLSLLEHLTIDFSSHFILSLIDVYRDMTTRDKLIFPSAITRILRHFFIPFPISNYFHVMCAIDAATIKWSEVQLCMKQSGMVIPSSSTALSTSDPSSSTGGVSLEDIMAQLVRMDAGLNTLSDKLCQVNTRVGHIARQQVVIGGFVDSPPPTPKAFKDEEDDADADASNAKDDGASSSSANKMSN